MTQRSVIGLFTLTGLLAAGPTASAQSPLILNEYNAVAGDKHLKDGGVDAALGRVAGNGGHWFELIVTQQRPDLRGIQLRWVDANGQGVVTLADDPFWADLPRGTIVTLTDGPHPTDTALDPAEEDWHVNINVNDSSLVSIDAFRTTNDDWALSVTAPDGETLFGPVGEGASHWPGGGVGSQEVGALIADPSPLTDPAYGYDDLAQSTFGQPNRWEHNDEAIVQSFDDLRGGSALVRAARPSLGAADANLRLEKLATIDVPGWTAEIVQYHPGESLLLSTNAMWDTVDIFHVTSLDPPILEPFDFDPDEPDAQGVWTVGEPTSVAVHPQRPIALATALSQDPIKPGSVIGIDLRRPTLGDSIVLQNVGYHPDCIAISPDGRWALVACEGEGLPGTPGSIWAIKLDQLTAEHRPWDGPMPAHELPGLGELLDQFEGGIEPEYIAFDPQSRFALVSCQENDALVLVDLRPTVPELAGVIWLLSGAEPDGVAVLDDVTGPDGRMGCLVAAAEEGRFDRYGRQLGNALSLTWIDPADLDAPPVPASRVDLRAMVDPDKPDERRDPESVLLQRFAGRDLAIVGIERGDFLLVLDVTDPTQPIPIDRARVGDRPEGLIAVPQGESLLLITGDEGNRGPGTVSFLRLAAPGSGS